MNTQGWVRGLYKKSVTSKDFMKHVASCFAREFSMDSYVHMKGRMVELVLGGISVTIQKKDIQKHYDAQFPYALDKFLLDLLQKKGFKFDKARSQYIRYCYGLLYFREDGTAY